MKGPMPIEVPEFITQEWYLGEKKKGKYDPEIAAELHISNALLGKWKRDRGIYCTPEYKRSGRKYVGSEKRAWELRQLGWGFKDIAKELDVTERTVHDYVSKMRKRVI